MKVVMTLLARDEADIVAPWLDFHLNAGADFVVATDNRSQDGTTEVLERYAREGHVHLIRELGEDLRQDEWVTRMARLAAKQHGADWVINSDADEFWWPRGPSLRDVLAAIPERYGTVGAFLRVFVPRPGAGPFAERMTVRFSALAPINDPASLYKPIRKVIHRGHPEIRLTRGNHALVGSPFAPLRGWFPVEVFHFPLRTAEQTAHKAYLQGTAFQQHIDRAPTAYHRNMFAALERRADRRLLRVAGRQRRRARPRRGGWEARGRHSATRRATCSCRRGDADVSDPDARRRRGVRRRGGGARRGRRRPAATSSRRAGGSPGHARGAYVDARLPEADAHRRPCARSRATGLTGWEGSAPTLSSRRPSSGDVLGMAVDLLDEQPGDRGVRASCSAASRTRPSSRRRCDHHPALRGHWSTRRRSRDSSRRRTGCPLPSAATVRGSGRPGCARRSARRQSASSSCSDRARRTTSSGSFPPFALCTAPRSGVHLVTLRLLGAIVPFDLVPARPLARSRGQTVILHSGSIRRGSPAPEATRRLALAFPPAPSTPAGAGHEVTTRLCCSPRRGALRGAAPRRVGGDARASPLVRPSAGRTVDLVENRDAVRSALADTEYEGSPPSDLPRPVLRFAGRGLPHA